jgi:hypothetical protein
MMEQNVKMSKMKERMRKKAETHSETTKTNVSYRENYDSNKSTSSSGTNNIKLDDLTSNLSSLMEEMKNNTSFIDDIIKKQGQQGQRDANINANANTMCGDDNSKRKSNNKRKVNKKNK